METVFWKIVEMSVTTSVLILAVMALRLLLRGAPGWINGALWALVGVSLLLPVRIESVVSLAPRVNLAGTGSVTGGRGAALELSTMGSALPQGAPEHAVTAGPALLPLLWIFGVCALLLYALIRGARWRRRVKAAVRLRENIWQSEAAPSAFVLGFFRPRIYLPFALDGEEREYVIAHERAHIERLDHWWRLTAYLLLAVYWFNPLIWIAYFLFCRDVELACDERVIRRMGREERANYSAALLACSTGRHPRHLLAFGEVGVKQRVRGILNYKKPARVLIIVAVVLCAVTAVCFLTAPQDGAVFGREYETEAVLYAAPQYSFAYTPENAPRYSLTWEGTLSEKGGLLSDEGEWKELGHMVEGTLTEENFDRLFLQNGPEGWTAGSAAAVREKNARAWQLTAGEYSYYLLKQRDGAVYLTYGYGAPEAKNASIRFLLALRAN